MLFINTYIVYHRPQEFNVFWEVISCELYVLYNIISVAAWLRQLYRLNAVSLCYYVDIHAHYMRGVVSCCETWCYNNIFLNLNRGYHLELWVGDWYRYDNYTYYNYILLILGSDHLFLGERKFVTPINVCNLWTQKLCPCSFLAWGGLNLK